MSKQIATTNAPADFYFPAAYSCFATSLCTDCELGLVLGIDVRHVDLRTVLTVREAPGICNAGIGTPDKEGTTTVYEATLFGMLLTFPSREWPTIHKTCQGCHC